MGKVQQQNMADSFIAYCYESQSSSWMDVGSRQCAWLLRGKRPIPLLYVDLRLILINCANGAPCHTLLHLLYKAYPAADVDIAKGRADRRLSAMEPWKPSKHKKNEILKDFSSWRRGVFLVIWVIPNSQYDVEKVAMKAKGSYWCKPAIETTALQKVSE